jgi:hypothetical protein
MITLHSTLSRRWSLATLGVGMVLLTRTSEALIGFAPLIVYLHDLGVGHRIERQWHFLPQRWPSVRELAVILTPFIVALLILLVHNKLYFGNPLSTGYDIHDQQDSAHFKYGVLSWHYIWPNFVVDFLRWPNFYFSSISDVNPQTDLLNGGIGTSMFFSTPLLMIFLFSRQGRTAQPWLRYTLWTTTAILLLAILCFEAAGANQVGARYLFPIYPPLFLLLAMRAAPLDIRWIGLAGLSIFINLLLARTFWYKPPSMLFTVACASIIVLACGIAIIMLQRQRHHDEIVSVAPVTLFGGSTSSNESAETIGAQPKEVYPILDK